jgi:hypothetical protein
VEATLEEAFNTEQQAIFGKRFRIYWLFVRRGAKARWMKGLKELSRVID